MKISSLQRPAFALASAVLALGLTVCAAPRPDYPVGGYQQGAYSAPERGVEYGRVTNIYQLQSQGSGRTSGAGAVIGAVVGGVLGHQIGGGSGRTLATAAGAVGGAVAGNAIEERNSAGGRANGYRIVIRLDQGGQRDYDVSSPGDLRVGDRVRMVNGQISRY